MITGKNQLATETSPYLLQHAGNPVHWLPWGPDALALAREQDKPILLSIGYSACHWCHVMAHESFEDETTARVMNELYINIKVDREERPDLDRIYQRAHQLLTQRAGGWPLTLMLTPDEQMPIFAGTYFPQQSSHGLPSFTDILQRVAGFYHEHRDEIERQSDSLREAISSLQPQPAATRAINPAPLDIARRQLEQNMDWQLGGFGQAPKFPHPDNHRFLLHHWQATGNTDQRALDMVTTSLTRMAEGGLNDQVGGGFCRYSVDNEWMIPHFEKMLYDNGPLLGLYAEAWLATGNELFKTVCQTTAEWLLRDMQTETGGFCSSLDADSEGIEGKFYAWSREQVKNALDDNEYHVFSRRFGLDREPNFEGVWYPHTFATLQELSKDTGIAKAELQRLLASSREKLYRAREQRIHPGRDDKILTSWNALVIRGLATAARTLGEPVWVESLQQAIDFIRTTLWHQGRLLATCRDGRAHLDAYLDDHAMMLDALLESLQCHWRTQDLDFAIELANSLLQRFEDPDQGGFFFTANDHEQLIERSKPAADESMPSGNGIAARALQRLGYLVGEQRYIDAAERTLAALWPNIENLPYAHASLLLALQEYLQPPTTVIIRGPSGQLPDWQHACQQQYRPGQACYTIPSTVTRLPASLATKKAAEQTRAWICQGFSCLEPVDTAEALYQAL